MECIKNKISEFRVCINKQGKRNKTLSWTNISKFMIILSLIILNGIMFDDAFAYIDPGSGSVVIQMIIGALVGVGVTIKVYWEKIKMKLSSFRQK